MSSDFRAVQWNRRKLVYDGILLAALALYLGLFIAIGRWWLSPIDDPATWEDLAIRALGSAAFLMLSVILSIGPLARLDRRFLVLLYNRRHFGVLTFLVAAVHGWLNINWFVSRGKSADLLAILGNLPNYATITHFPYDTLGIIVLVIMFVMAATSHDFWLHVLTPRRWKTLHMAIYVAYGVLVMHVATGVMQSHHSPLIPIALGGIAGTVAILHLLAGWRERITDRGTRSTDDGWIVVGPALSIPDGAARIVVARGGERIAVFRDGNRVGALSNLCAHQNGPIGEGRIINGCVTCPWHGYEYRLEDGCAPAPYTEKLETFRVRIVRGIAEVDPRPLPPGTRVLLARIENT